MEKAGSTWGQETVISELTKGKEFANQLQKELNPAATNSREVSGFLLERILSSYDNALTLLDCMASLGNGKHPSKIMLESPVSFEGNHRSEASLTDSKDHEVNVSKKRKTVPKMSEQVRVCSGTRVEYDGYNWRKFGQKDIQGTNHPREYFRCTYRHTQGCLATKQVQRTDRYQSPFDVIYRGKHTCMREKMKHNGNVDIRKKKEEEECTKQVQRTDRYQSPFDVIYRGKHTCMPEKMKHNGNVDIRKKKEEEEECTKPALKVQTQEKYNEEDNFLDFSFQNTPVACENMEMRFCAVPQSIIESSHSPPFLSPATSESYFSLSPRQMNDFGIDHNLPSSESDFTEIISNPTPLANFPPGDFDFLLDFFDFDTPFP